MKTKIQITYIAEGRESAAYFDKVLLLRSARAVGDTEVVNNTQLGRLNQAKADGSIDFVKI